MEYQRTAGGVNGRSSVHGVGNLETVEILKVAVNAKMAVLGLVEVSSSKICGSGSIQQVRERWRCNASEGETGTELGLAHRTHHCIVNPLLCQAQKIHSTYSIRFPLPPPLHRLQLEECLQT